MPARCTRGRRPRWPRFKAELVRDEITGSPGGARSGRNGGCEATYLRRADRMLSLSRTQNGSGRHRRAEATAERGRPDLSVLARGGTLNLFGLGVSGLMQVVLTVVVARGLGTRGTGAFFEAVALFTILSNVGE